MPEELKPNDSAPRLISRAASCESGNIAILAAIMMPMLFILVGMALDFGSISSQRSKLQVIADAAALAAGRDLTLAGGDTDRVKAVARSFVAAQVDKPFNLKSEVDEKNLRVTVNLAAPMKSNFGPVFGLQKMLPEAQVTAVSEIIGTQRLCVLGLDSSESHTVSLEKKSNLTANGCAVFSNSTHKHGLVASSASVLKAKMICSAGGKKGGKKMFKPAPVVDCPEFDDPLASRKAPSAPHCTTNNLILDGSADPFIPAGAHCGGVTITNGEIAKLEAGIHYFVDGPLVVRNGGRISGRDVSLVFQGSDARLFFAQDSSIDLGASSSGALAGILVFERRSQPKGNIFQVESDNAEYLLGTVYIPQGTLQVNGTKPVANSSEWTAIVARHVRLDRSPHLVLNTNYDLTDVPVPNGIKGVGSPITLIR